MLILLTLFARALRESAASALRESAAGSTSAFSSSWFCAVKFEQIELPTKLLNYFLRSNKSHINQSAASRESL